MRLDEADQSDNPVGGNEEMLAVSSRRIDDRAVLVLTGELDPSGTAIAVSTGQAMLDADPPPTTIEIAAAGLGFVDSAGIAALLEIRQLAGAADVEFAIADASAQLRRLIEVSGLVDIFFPPRTG